MHLRVQSYSHELSRMPSVIFHQLSCHAVQETENKSRILFDTPSQQRHLRHTNWTRLPSSPHDATGAITSCRWWRNTPRSHVPSTVAATAPKAELKFDFRAHLAFHTHVCTTLRAMTAMQFHCTEKIEERVKYCFWVYTAEVENKKRNNQIIVLNFSCSLDKGCIIYRRKISMSNCD